MAYGPPETRHPLLFRASVDAMINMDAPWHLQLRKEHMPYFTLLSRRHPEESSR